MAVQHALVLERIEIMVPVTMIKPIPRYPEALKLSPNNTQAVMLAKIIIECSNTDT